MANPVEHLLRNAAALTANSLHLKSIPLDLNMSNKGSLLLPTLSGSLPRTSNLLTVRDTAEGPQNPTGPTFVTDEELKQCFVNLRSKNTETLPGISQSNVTLAAQTRSGARGSHTGSVKNLLVSLVCQDISASFRPGKGSCPIPLPGNQKVSRKNQPQLRSIPGTHLLFRLHIELIPRNELQDIFKRQCQELFRHGYLHKVLMDEAVGSVIQHRTHHCLCKLPHSQTILRVKPGKGGRRLNISLRGKDKRNYKQIQ